MALRKLNITYVSCILFPLALHEVHLKAFAHAPSAPPIPRVAQSTRLSPWHTQGSPPTSLVPSSATGTPPQLEVFSPTIRSMNFSLSISTDSYFSPSFIKSHISKMKTTELHIIHFLVLGLLFLIVTKYSFNQQHSLAALGGQALC